MGGGGERASRESWIQVRLETVQAQILATQQGQRHRDTSQGCLASQCVYTWHSHHPVGC